MSSSSRKRPPDGAPWDLPLDETPWVFIDLEMTGLDAAKHRVIEICVERCVDGAVVGELHSFCRPEPLPDKVGNEHVHGITRDALVEAPTFGELIDRLTALLDCGVLVAHGARWDASFLRAEMERAGRGWTCDHYIDTLALARRRLKAPSFRLTALAEQLDIANPTPHRAHNDVQVTRALFERLLAEPSPAPMTSARDIWNACVGKLSVSPDVLARAEQQAGTDTPVTVRYRPAGRAEREFEFVVTQVLRNLDPPVVLGYLLRTRGRRELRADRILSLEPIPAPDGGVREPPRTT